MLAAATILCFVWLGYEIAVRCWRDRASALELCCAALTVGSILWLSSVWLAALLHHLDRPTMLVRTMAAGIAAAVAWWRRRGTPTSDSDISRTAVILYVVPSIPVLLWIVFVLWRATVVPPVSHDALAYHLPRAVLFTRLHGYDHLDFANDVRLRTLPANYEMLISDFLLLEKNDFVTEWIATFFYIAFVIACGALVQRWWRSSFVPAFATMLLVAGVPLLLLHAGADKNDTMGAFFMISGLLFAGRWIAERDRWALLLSTVSFAAGIGTKPQAGVLGACVAPFLLWRLVVELRERRLPVRFATGFVALCLASVFLLGGVAYLANLRHGPNPIDVRLQSDAPATRGLVPYGDWANFWQAPWVLITAPFSSSDGFLFVPWEREPWFWKRYEIYFSHLGIPFAVCALLLPFAVFLYRNDGGQARRERLIGTAVAVVALLLIIPVRFIPHGMYLISLPRYALFILPVVFGWTVAPAVQRLSQRGTTYLLVLLYASAAWFAREAVDYGANDRFVPIGYVSWAASHPGTRSIPFDWGRAASVADQFVGPDEKVAFDGGFGAWLQPAFGASLQRPVEFIPPGREVPRISDDVKWVIIDQGWHVIWEQPEFTDLSQSRTFLGKGRASPGDTRVLAHLSANRQFEPVYYNPVLNQAVFRRRDAAGKAR